MPFYRFVVDVSLPVSEVVARLRRATRTSPQGFVEAFRSRFAATDPAVPPFIGVVRETSFRIRRDIRYRNSFLPLVWGSIAAAPTGSRIQATMFLHPFVAVFIILWLSACGSLAWGLIFAGWAYQGMGAAALLPVGMFVFGTALTLGGFFPEAVRAKRLLMGALRSDT
jgi:hypothetical protein